MGKQFKTSLTLFVMSLLLVSSAAHAEWAGVFLFRMALFDHIHVSVSEDGKFDEATQLNIWNNVATAQLPMAIETEEASKFVLFHYDHKSKDQIVREWTDFFVANYDDRSLTSKNCAWATDYVLNNILNLNIPEHSFTFSRSFLFFWLPNFGHGIPFPDSVRIRLKDQLKKDGIRYYTSRNGRGAQLIEKIQNLQRAP